MTETLKNSSPITLIDRHKNLSPKELLNEYVIPRKPVILTEAIKNWKALDKWNPEFFKAKYGNIERETGNGKVKIGDYMDMMFSSTDEKPAPYPFNFNIEHYFPELMQDIKPTLVYGKSDRLSHPLLPHEILRRTHAHEIFFGGRGAYFPLHFDEMFMHTQITQIFGDKEFYMFAPDQSEFLYPTEDNFKVSAIDNIFKIDHQKFPLFKKARLVKEMVHQGETLFFPNGWWHTTLIPGPSITYGRAQLNSNNYNKFLGDYYNFWIKKQPVKTCAYYSYGKALGVLMNMQEVFA